jgi:hypothetical protein
MTATFFFAFMCFLRPYPKFLAETFPIFRIVVYFTEEET